MIKDKKFSKSKIRKEIEIVDVLMIFIILGVYLFILFHSSNLIETAEEKINSYGSWGLLISSFILELVPQLFDPGFGVFIAMAAGMTLFRATVIIIIGSLFGGYLSYEIGRKYGLKIISYLFKKEILDKTIFFFNKYGKYLLLVGALTPLPYFPIIFGALGLSREKFIFYGLIPRAISFILFGVAIYYGIGFINLF